MKKFIAVVVLTPLLAIALCLFGCSSADTLDRTVTIENMSINVPSNWIENENDYSAESSGSKIGSKSFRPENYSSQIIIGYSNQSLDQTAAEAMWETRESYASDLTSATNFNSIFIDEFSIDGATCTLYDFSYTTTAPDTEETFVASTRMAFIFAEDIHYDIRWVGDPSMLDAMIKTIKLT